MFIVVTCNQCGKQMRVADDHIGKRLRCPDCGNVFTAENQSESSAAIAQGPPPLEPPAAPMPPAPKKRRPFPPVPFQLTVKDDPNKLLRGTLKAEVDVDGILVAKGTKKEFDIPIDTRAEYTGGNVVQIVFDGRPVTFAVGKMFHYPNRFAEDLAAYMRGDIARLRGEDYRVPWLLFVFALLPLGIPMMTLGGAIPGAVGGGLTALSFVIAQQERWPLVARIGAMLAVAAVGFAAVVFLIVLPNLN